MPNLKLINHFPLKFVPHILTGLQFRRTGGFYVRMGQIICFISQY